MNKKQNQSISSAGSKFLYMYRMLWESMLAGIFFIKTNTHKAEPHQNNVCVKLALMGEVQLSTVTPISQKMGRNLLN